MRHNCLIIVFFAMVILFGFCSEETYAKKFKSDGAYLSYYNNTINRSTDSFIRSVSMSSKSEIGGWELFLNPYNNSSNYFQQPTGIWLTGRADDMSILSKTLLLSRQQVPVYVIYFSPSQGNRVPLDKEINDYLNKNKQIASTIASNKAIIVLEPDLLCLSTDSRSLLNVNKQILSKTVKIYKKYSPNARVYLDAGHSNWHSPTKMSNLLKGAGIELADGFSTNVSNFQYTNQEVQYAVKLSKLLGNKRYVIDTGRNGNGPGRSRNGAPVWSDPVGVTTGEKPTTVTDITGLDAFLWVKPPGEADGSFAPAGTWLPMLISLD